MKLRRIGVLFGKEFVYNAKNFFFIFAIIVPIVVTLVISLVFGSLFSEKPKLGILDQGGSRFVAMATELESLISREYSSVSELMSAVEIGAVDIGVVLPAGFDSLVEGGEQVEISAYIWGESLLKNRAILGAAIASLIRNMSAEEAPVEVIMTTVGDGENIPWEDRLLPLIALLAVILGGSLVPASSLVDEKQKRTLTALTTTTASLGEVFLAKGLMGGSLSLVMGVVTLVLNRAFGTQPLLMLLVLALSATLAAAFGLLLGALIKDVNTLFATVKGMGIILYAPAILYWFPQLPEWIAKIFPTYYIIGPIIEISQKGATWPDIATDVYILVGLILVMVGVLAFILNRARRQEA